MKKQTVSLWSLLSVTLVCLLFTVSSHAGTRGLKIVFKDPSGKEVGIYKSSYALIIGVSQYSNGWPSLPGVRSDVISVKNALEKQGFQVETVMDPDAVKLRAAFDAFITKHGQEEENRLLFYFAGHGHTLTQSWGDEMGYIVPSDAPNPNRDQQGFMAKALDMQMMEVYAKRIQSKHALFLFDSCFSGSIFSLSRAVPENISYKTSQPVRQFITAGAANEQVPDESVFRQQFVSALKGEADNDHDGYITGVELGEFLQAAVTNYSKGAQHPQYGKIRHPKLDKGDFVFVSPLSGVHDIEQTSGKTVANQTPLPLDPASFELAFWETIKDSKNPEDFRAYLKEYPNGRFVSLAKLRSGNKQERREPVSTKTPQPVHKVPPVEKRDFSSLNSGTFQGNASDGEKIASVCRACHNFNDRNKVGPGLAHVVGRRAGTHEGFPYGSALKTQGWYWTEENLMKWVCDSQATAKALSGDSEKVTKMPPQKICGQRAADVVAFLKSLQ